MKTSGQVITFDQYEKRRLALGHERRDSGHQVVLKCTADGSASVDCRDCVWPELKAR